MFPDRSTKTLAHRPSLVKTKTLLPDSTESKLLDVLLGPDFSHLRLEDDNLRHPRRESGEKIPYLEVSKL